MSPLPLPVENGGEVSISKGELAAETGSRALASEHVCFSVWFVF